MKMTIAQNFFQDPLVKKAKIDILDALKAHQRSLTGICPAEESLKENYDKTIKNFEEQRGGNLIFPYLGSGIGKGALVELADGSVKYDFIIGVGVHYLGHSHAGLIEACLDASIEDTVMQGNLQQNKVSADFTAALLDLANDKAADFEHCFLTATGVMAGENALKIAFQKKSPADRVICFKGCFMGRTLVMAQTTDNAAYREGLPKTIPVDYVPFFDANKPEESTEAAVKALKKHIEEHPGKHAAMCFELVLGEGGFYPGTHDFFVALMTVCREHDIPVLVDEVQSFVRTPEPFAFQYFDLDDFVDVVWFGKASQVCGTLFKSHMKPKPGLLSQTYTASSTAIAAGLFVLQFLLQNNCFGVQGKIQKTHDYFIEKLQKLEEAHPDLIKGPYGIGSMIAFTPFEGDPDKVKTFINKLYEAGVIGFYCGHHPCRVRFLVPIGAIDQKDIDVVMGVITETLLQC